MGNTLIGLSPRMREALGSGYDNLARGVNSIFNGVLSFYQNGLNVLGEYDIPEADMVGQTRSYLFEVYTNPLTFDQHEPVPMPYIDGQLQFRKTVTSAQGSATLTINGTNIETTDTTEYIKKGKFIVEITCTGTWLPGDEVLLELTNASIPAGNQIFTPEFRDPLVRETVV